MIGCRNLNLIFLFYYFTSHSVYTTHGKQAEQNVQGLDGSEFMKHVVNGSKLNSRPKFLMFTAPYKLCDGECSDENLAIGFPVYLGNYAKKVYKDTYIENYNREEPSKSSHRTTRRPNTYTNKSSKKRRQTPSRGRSTTSTEPPMFQDNDSRMRLYKKKNKKTDCPCPYLDPTICYKKQISIMRQKKPKIVVDDIKKLFTAYRKTKDIS